MQLLKVLLQILTLDKAALANVTCVRPLACVHSHMHLQLAVVKKPFVAHITFGPLHAVVSVLKVIYNI